MGILALRVCPHSEEEINNMKSELEKYGIQMPAFSKIGGILANELSVDEAACKTSLDLSHCQTANNLLLIYEIYEMYAKLNICST